MVDWVMLTIGRTNPKFFAGLGFSDILGIEIDEITEELGKDGGAWASNISCEDTRSRTFTSTREDIELVFLVQNPYADDFKEGALGLDALPRFLPGRLKQIP